MTAVIAMLENDHIIVASDTLTCCEIKDGDTELKPLIYMSKTFYLPTFKSIFSGTGLPQFALSFFNFITVNTFGDDIDSIINTSLADFRNIWENNNSDSDNTINQRPETIYLFGFSINENRLKGMKLVYNKNEEFSWQQFSPENKLIISPAPGENIQEKLAKYNNSNLQEYVANIMKILKEEDESKEIIDRTGIGGEIQISQLGFDANNNFFIGIQNVYKFD